MSDARAEALTYLVLGALALVALAFLWNHLVHFLQRVILPFCRKILGERIGNLLTELVVFLDGKVCPAREVLVSAWQSFQHSVLGIRQTYRRVSPSTVEEVTLAHLRTNDNKVAVQTSTRTLSWAEVPADIREQMARAAKEEVNVNAKEVVAERFKERVEEEGIELTLEA